ncbi:MAG: VirB8/TrbF family protein [Spirochaetaceae bacterium]|nr:VirB8/TrbF family protein [Spirochaetaceae bacterium]
MSDPKRGTHPADDFAEIWESERRNASYLRVGTGAMLVLLLALSTGWCRSASGTLQPVFVRVDGVGRAEALDYQALTWQNDPLHRSTKYFLRQFVSDHYSRRFATVAERWPHSLAFLERTLAAASAEAHQEEIAEFSAGLVREERAVENLVLRVLARPEEPHEAVADYDVVRRLNAREVGRERWTTNMQFVFRDVDPYELTTNPIGLTITYYAADRAVSSGE